ncbi:MAG: TolC family protein [Candidatus Eremiobacteraeota bacterium]|nr:TolC family protein [Candidatus Eremiobacteraeota bacterium]
MNRFALVVLLAINFSPQSAVAQPAPVFSLTEAIAEAESKNPDIVAAQRAIDIDRARLQQAAQPPLQLQAGPSVGLDVPGGVGTVQTISAAVFQQFTASGSLPAARSVASAGIVIASALLQATRRDVQRRVINTYYALASSQAQVVAARQNVATGEELLRSAELRKRAGAVGQFEVLRANVELRRSQTDLLRAEAAERVESIRLSALIGRADNLRSQPVAVKIVPFPESDERSLFDRAAAIDPTVAQLRATVDQAEARARLAQAQRAPSIGINAGFQILRAPINGRTSFGPTAGLALTVPLFDYGTIKGAVREAQAASAYARAQLDSRIVQVRTEIAQAVADVQSARVRQSFTAASLQQAEESLRVAQFGYRQGALGTLDVLAARNALSNARADSDQALADLAASIARLQLNVGEPITQ